MSLLLDALKKAAQEKQNADSADSSADSPAEDKPATESPQPDDAFDTAGSLDELELDELELDDDALAATSEPDEETEIEIQPAAVVEPSTTVEQRRVTATPSTVSDEALQLLIHKTNNEHKKSRRVIWGGVVSGTLVLLLISGLYLYSGMTDEIESMQRKQQIALASLKSKTRIEENLTSLAVVPEEKKATHSVDSKAGKSVTQLSKSNSTVRSDSAIKKMFSVERAEKRDPVSELLQKAWTAYQNQDYASAKSVYKMVLAKEPHNHDANLGIAAVAMQTGDLESARDIYIQLLERDPRDPHAHSGLANIAQSDGASLSESRLKQLIGHRPDDPNLQFALGNLYVQKQSWPDAQQAFFNAWKGDSQNADYAYNLAVSLDHLGKHKEALAYYQDSLKLATSKNISFSTDAVRSRVAYLGSRR